MVVTWTEEAKTNFLVHLVMAGGAKQSNFADIAEKMGPPHTTGSLAIKWHRIKKDYEKTWPAVAGSGPVKNIGEKKGKTGGSKRKKATKGDSEDEGDHSEEVTKRINKGKTGVKKESE